MCLTMTPELPLLDRLGKEHIRCSASNRTFNHQRRSDIYLLPMHFVRVLMASAAFGSYTMWAYSNLPHQTVLSEAKWLKAFFTLSLVANALATCEMVNCFRTISYC